MEAIEIPEDQRGLSFCKGCKSRHYCSWHIDGHYYCGDCADKVRGIVKEDEVEMEPLEEALEKVKTITLGNTFTVEPDKIINVSIGKLATGYIATIDGAPHVFARWCDLIDKLELLEPEVDDANN